MANPSFSGCTTRDPHYPFTPPAPFDRTWWGSVCDDCPDQGSIPTIREIQSGPSFDQRQIDHLLGLYDGEIAFVDQGLSRLLRALDRLGLEQDTLIVVIGDHGESFGELGRWLHGHDLYDPEIPPSR